uniref:Uncharacterized protein n=1 Tax=Arundo donax TaxID=35708 RepID=A0A0A9CI49_ARUDO
MYYHTLIFTNQYRLLGFHQPISHCIFENKCK